MAAALAAEHFGADHPVRDIAPFLNRVALHRAGEGGPAAAAVVLGIALEQHLSPPGAAICSLFEMLVILAGEAPFGPSLPQHMTLIGAEPLAPSGIAQFLGLAHRPLLPTPPPHNPPVRPATHPP